MKYVFIIIIVLSLFVVACEEEQPLVLISQQQDKLCKQSDVYCHVIKTNIDKAYLNFSSVNDDIFIYRVET